MSIKPTEITEGIYNYILENFAPEDTFLKTLKEESDTAGMPRISISPDQAQFLQLLTKLINARYILEIGSLGGYSAISIARALPMDGKLIAVEINPDYAYFISRKVIEAGLSGVIDVYNKSGLEFLNKFKPNYQLDMVFIDADKTSYIEYFKVVDKLLRPGGLFIADNTLAFGEIINDPPSRDKKNVLAIREFNKFILTQRNYKSSLLTIGDGLLISLKLK